MWWLSTLQMSTQASTRGRPLSTTTHLWQQYWPGLLAGEAGATLTACPSPLPKDLLAGGLLAESCAAAPRPGRLALLASPCLPCAVKLHWAMSMLQDCA